MIPKIGGVIETSLYVSDLARSLEFFQRVFGFELILQDADRLRALSVSNRQVLLLFRREGTLEAMPTPGGVIPPHDGSGNLHLAFAVEAKDLSQWEQHLEAEGVIVESRVTCPGGGHSIYFRDPDGHLLELITPGCWRIY